MYQKLINQALIDDNSRTEVIVEKKNIQWGFGNVENSLESTSSINKKVKETKNEVSPPINENRLRSRTINSRRRIKNWQQFE